MSFKHYAMQEAKQQFVEYDKNSDGSVGWDEYNIQMYDRVIDFDENTVLDDAEEESFRQVSRRGQLPCGVVPLPLARPRPAGSHFHFRFAFHRHA